MNSTYKLNALTVEGLQELKSHEKNALSLCKKVKIKNKRSQSALNAKDKLESVYANKIDKPTKKVSFLKKIGRK